MGCLVCLEAQGEGAWPAVRPRLCLVVPEAGEQLGLVLALGWSLCPRSVLEVNPKGDCCVSLLCPRRAATAVDLEPGLGHSATKDPHGSLPSECLLETVVMVTLGCSSLLCGEM